MEEVFVIADVEVNVLFKNIKNTHLSVHPPDGRVTISAPLEMDIEKLKHYAISKLGWIKKQREKIITQPRENSKLFITQESHYFLGQRYLLKILEVESGFGVELKQKDLILRCCKNASYSEREQLINQFYKIQLKEIIEIFFKKYQSLLNSDVAGFTIRMMKTKWGGYSKKTRKIIINTDLAKKPKHLIEYIVLHEMIHYFDPKHGKVFKTLMSKYMQNWELRKKELNELPI